MIDFLAPCCFQGVGQDEAKSLDMFLNRDHGFSSGTLLNLFPTFQLLPESVYISFEKKRKR